MRRQIACAAAAAFAISALAACGSVAGTAATPLNVSLPVTPAAALQNAAGYLGTHSFHVTASAEAGGVTGLRSLSKALASLGKGSQSVAFGVSGDVSALDGATGRADLRITFSGSGTLVKLAKAATGGSAIRAAIVDDGRTSTVYLNDGRTVDGRHWLTVGGADAPSTGPSLAQSLAGLTLLGEAGSLRLVGSGPNGTVEIASSVTAQSARAALAKAKKAGNATEAGELKRVANELAKAPGATLLSDFWLNPTTYAPAKATFIVIGVPDVTRSDATVTFSKFGESVDVTAPAASDTYTSAWLDNLLGRG